jgi:hypothetical protein
VGTLWSPELPRANARPDWQQGGTEAGAFTEIYQIEQK